MQYVTVFLQDSEGGMTGTLLMSNYPTNIFYMKAATTNEAKLILKEVQNELIHKDGNIPPMKVQQRLKNGKYLQMIYECKNEMS